MEMLASIALGLIIVLALVWLADLLLRPLRHDVEHLSRRIDRLIVDEAASRAREREC